MPERRRALAALAALLAAACSESEAPEEGLRGFPGEEVRGQIERLYREAREAGERVPADAYEWARSDVDRIGDWEYRVLRLAAADDAALEARLAELGSERWEVFWLEPAGSGYRAFAKRPARSWLRHVPLSELRRLWPEGTGE